MKRHNQSTQSVDLDRAELLSLIDDYFEGRTSLDDEARLRAALATTACSDEAVDEARAVMGVFAMSRSRRPSLRHSHIPAMVAAAVVAVLLIAAAVLTIPNGNLAADDMHLAYTEPFDVASIIESDMKLMGEASREVSSDIHSELAGFGELLEVSDMAQTPVDGNDSTSELHHDINQSTNIIIQ
jgi:hypothetical protein